MNRIAALLLLSLTFVAQAAVSGSRIAPEHARRMAQGAAAEILDALARRDFGKLAAFVSEEGLAVSPYVMLHDGTVRLSRSEIERCASDPQARHWGEMDGTGDPIEITCGRYFDEFVWTADYRQADEVLYNEPRRRGNDINNNHEFAPDGIVVEFHIRGKSSLLELDWKSLRLIFRNDDQGLSLIAITRDVWTI